MKSLLVPNLHSTSAYYVATCIRTLRRQQGRGKESLLYHGNYVQSWICNMAAQLLRAR